MIMRKLIIIFLFLAVNVWFALGWTPPSPITPPDTIPDAIANMNFGITGGSVPSAPGAATDYTADAYMISYWMMEQATGAGALDGSATNNDLTAFGDASGPTQSATSQEGTYSCDYESSDEEGHIIADASIAGNGTYGFPGSTNASHTSSFSAGAWVRAESAVAYAAVMGKWAEEDLSWAIRYHAVNTSWNFLISNDGSAETNINSDTTPTMDGTVWYHVVGVFDDTANLIYIYVNGYSDATAVAHTTALNTNAVSFRVANTEASAKFDGLVDEVFVIARALSAAEVLEIYTSGLDGGG